LFVCQKQVIPVNILGLSGLAHDCAAALLSDTGILAAMEESKLVRRRTATGIPLDGFLLPGGRVRLHVVERKANPLLWHLLDRFGQIASAPMLVNTSFNLFGEPLVVSPRDAVRSYFCSGVDALIIGNFSLAKA
jgi:predicted NodU family carbamoyl transferase